MALSVICKVPEYDALAVGLKVTSIMQLAPEASELPQGVALDPSVKTDEPDKAMLLIVSVVPPVFLSVTVLVVMLFGARVPKLRLLALRLA